MSCAWTIANAAYSFLRLAARRRLFNRCFDIVITVEMSAGYLIRIEVQDPKNNASSLYHKWLLDQGLMYDTADDAWALESGYEPIRTRYYNSIVGSEEDGRQWRKEIKAALREFGHKAGVQYRNHINVVGLYPSGPIAYPEEGVPYKIAGRLATKEVPIDALDAIVRRV
jgi:hypothetical protein